MAIVQQERIALGIASVVLVVAIIFAAVGVPGSDEESDLAADTTAPASTAPTTSSAAATAAAAVAPQATVTPAAVPSGAPTDSTPIAAVPPKGGTYRYRETANGETVEEELRITDRGSGRQTETTDDVIIETAWRPDAKYVLETTFRFGPQQFRCDWNPDVVEYKLPLATGASWEFKGTCTPQQGAQLEFDVDSTAVGTERIRVAGQDVNTWVVRSSGTVTFRSAQTTSTQKVTNDDRFSPAHGLSVRSAETIEGPDPSTGQNVKESTVREILTLTPA